MVSVIQSREFGFGLELTSINRDVVNNFAEPIAHIILRLKLL
jgi:hypothetical protein